MNADTRWNEMLDEFRALGGVADNIRLDHGPFGRGLFPIDPKKPVQISIPAYVLVGIDDVTFENDVFRVPEACCPSPRVRAFLEQYERYFSWGPGRAETEQFLHMMNGLPESVKQFLTTQMSLSQFFQPVTPAAVQKWFFRSRVVKSGNRNVIMPIIELANHGGTVRYGSVSGVSLNGTFEGEVLVRYAEPSDPFDMFGNWMFVPNEPSAFSLPLVGTFAGRQFDIRRQFENVTMPFVPKVSMEGGRIVASYLLLGHKRFPRVPKGAFRKAMESAQIPDVDETFDFILMINRQKFLDLLSVLEGVEQPGAAVLRRLAINQLTALSHQFGVRNL